MLAQVANNVEPFIDVKTILLALGLVTPFVTAVLKKSGASEALSGWISALVTALVGVVYTMVEADNGWDWQFFVNSWIQIGVAHLLSWEFLTRKPVAALNEATANVGLSDAPGTPPPPDH